MSSGDGDRAVGMHAVVVSSAGGLAQGAVRGAMQRQAVNPSGAPAPGAGVTAPIGDAAYSWMMAMLARNAAQSSIQRAMSSMERSDGSRRNCADDGCYDVGNTLVDVAHHRTHLVYAG